MQPNGSLTRYSSPLRYPGGKAKVANFLKLLIMHNSFDGMRYVEPYAGGASVALSLLFEGYVSHAHINDLNKGMCAFWRMALNQPDELCKRIKSIPLTMQEWHRQREIYGNQDASDDDLAFATFFLNRTNRSGIISGGVIGGLEQTGQWKIDARFNREALCERIQKIAERKSQITVTQLDAIELIKQERQRADSSFLYLDPPYYVKGARLYDNFYSHLDHVVVSKEIRATRSPWVVSYDAAPEILEMYDKCLNIRYSLGYSAAKAAIGTEVMFFSEGIILPNVSSPAGISADVVAKTRKARGTLA
ncbi:DNA adenine methylase [Actinomadura nitritigenes]|uniref:DNA adenine methylase n=1 Tax=Actinomadura nitritigenes TaxID=134602 RepID=UPI003D91EFDA